MTQLASTREDGIFISFEGGDGAGKSTHIRFLARALEALGYEVVCLREPGGTPISEALRAIVLDPDFESMADGTELLIYEASRHQLVDEVIRPALARGAVILCDRFSDSTVAYQAFGRGIDRSSVDRLNEFATGGLKPHRTLVLMPPDAASGLERATHNLGADRLELAGVEFHARVNDGFRHIVAEEPGRVRLIDSSQPKSQTARSVFSAVADIFHWDMDADFPAEFFAVLDKPKDEGGHEGETQAHG